jgi:hypothetical protein
MANERWAYQVIDIKAKFWGMRGADVQAELNRLGLQGWELVAVQPFGMATRLYLKRAQ